MTTETIYYTSPDVVVLRLESTDVIMTSYNADNEDFTLDDGIIIF